MNLPDFLTLGTMGEIRVTGHRIDLYLLAQKYNEGHTVEMLHCEYPHVALGSDSRGDRVLPGEPGGRRSVRGGGRVQD